MLIEQAIYTSAQTTQARGYHLVARSPGIDHRLAQQLALWAPSENSLIDRDVDADSLNVFPLEGGWTAISRTVIADAEYSDRGQFRVETNILAMPPDQFEDYHADPLAVARAALASGYLRLRAEIPTVLAPLPLPPALGLRQTSLDAVPTESPKDEPDVDEGGVDAAVVQAITEYGPQQRLVIVGFDEPLRLLRALYRALPVEQRRELSFATGLKPSTHRPFRLQFLPQVNNELARELAARGMHCLTM